MATESRGTEVWTNAHVVGAIGSTVTGEFRGTPGNLSTSTGIVAYRDYRTGRDVAKIVFPNFVADSAFSVADSLGGSDLHATAGYPHGDRIYALLVDAVPGKNFGEILAYRPVSISGQSGSPVVNANGKVIGVVTYRVGGQRDGHGGMMPISHWSKPTSPVSVLIGKGHFTELENVKAP